MSEYEAEAPITRSKEKTAALVSATIRDILTDKRLISLIESHVVDHLNEMKEELEKQEARILEMEANLHQKNVEVKVLQEHLETHTNTISRLQYSLNQQEQYSRRNCLRFFGIPEAPTENTNDLIIKLSTDVLKVELSKQDLERTHRLGKSQEGKPRAIIAKFKSYRKRDEVIKHRRKLAGSRKAILEDLTAINADLLQRAKNNENIKASWSLDGRIFAIGKTPGSTKKLIKSKEDIDSIR